MSDELGPYERMTDDEKRSYLRQLEEPHAPEQLFTQSDLTSAEARGTLVALEAAAVAIETLQPPKRTAATIEELEAILNKPENPAEKVTINPDGSIGVGAAPILTLGAETIRAIANSHELVAAKQKMVEDARRQGYKDAFCDKHAQAADIDFDECPACRIAQARLDGEKAGAAAEAEWWASPDRPNGPKSLYWTEKTRLLEARAAVNGTAGAI